MDLIYADVDRKDIGVMKNYTLDNEVSVDREDCTFEVQTVLDADIFNSAAYFYMENTEYGGIVDSKKVNTAKSTMYLSGRTWRGILASKVLEPNSGDDYLVANGDINDVLRDIIIRVRLTDIFDVSEEAFGQRIIYQFNRYTDAYTGIRKMLASKGLKLQLRMESRKVMISAVPIVDYNREQEITSDLFDFVIDQAENFPNHVIGLGSGDLSERQVVHRYIQEDGSVGSTQFYFDLDERTVVYDYSNAESLEDLIEKSEEFLLSQSTESGVKISTDKLDADVGDKFTATEEITGTTVEEYVVSKIYKISNSKISVSYKVGGIK